MPIIDSVLAEFEHEAATTRRLLERVPVDRSDFQPHEKSMTLGRLAQHTAEIPGWMRIVGTAPELDLGDDFTPPAPPATSDELLALYDGNVKAFKEVGAGLSDESLREPWKLRRGEKIFFDVPRIAAIRTFILNHFIHHRAQLSVYLRLLEVPVPSIYGPSADENVFA